MKIGIDKGHNLAVNRGASGIVQEDDLTLELGNILIAVLRSLNHEVIDCTPSKANTRASALKQRVRAANNAQVKIFASIHFNSDKHKQGYGTEVLHFPKSSKSISLAAKILPELASLGFRNRGLKPRPDLYVLKRTKMPAVIIEVCFCDSQVDMDLYRQRGAQSIAEAIARGLLRYDAT